MNAGVAWDGDSFNVVQHFNADRARFKEPPHLADGVLVMEGRTRDLPPFRDSRDLVVLIMYDPPLEDMGDNNQRPLPSVPLAPLGRACASSLRPAGAHFKNTVHHLARN